MHQSEKLRTEQSSWNTVPEECSLNHTLAHRSWHTRSQDLIKHSHTVGTQKLRLKDSGTSQGRGFTAYAITARLVWIRV
jgi:hypothetical protein